MRPRVLAVAFAATLGPPTASAGEPEPLALELRNDGARALRCVMVKAHFMSETLGTIAGGGRLAFALQRDPADGSLFVLAHDGRRQMIENILCGADDDWANTRGELPLLPLRRSAATAAELRCAADGRLDCSVKEADD